MKINKNNYSRDYIDVQKLMKNTESFNMKDSDVVLDKACRIICRRIGLKISENAPGTYMKYSILDINEVTIPMYGYIIKEGSNTIRISGPVEPGSEKFDITRVDLWINNPFKEISNNILPDESLAFEKNTNINSIINKSSNALNGAIEHKQKLLDSLNVMSDDISILEDAVNNGEISVVDSSFFKVIGTSKINSKVDAPIEDDSNVSDIEDAPIEDDFENEPNENEQSEIDEQIDDEVINENR